MRKARQECSRRASRLHERCAEGACGYTGSIFETPGPESVLLPLPGLLVTTI